MRYPCKAYMTYSNGRDNAGKRNLDRNLFHWTNVIIKLGIQFCKNKTYLSLEVCKYG